MRWTQVIALMMSDVVGNDLQYLSSGPTVPDFTTPQQCLDLLHGLRLYDVTPRSVITVLQEKVAAKIVIVSLAMM